MQPEVRIGDQLAEVLFSGAAPPYSGLYQVNVRVPAGLRPGTQTVVVAVNGTRSNSVIMAVR
jgi:uncharacterized protein (TIGR03437 family)